MSGRDPTGKKALFEARHGGDFTGPDGKEALFHTHRAEGDVLLHCSRCDAESVLTLTQALVGMAALGCWIPGKTFGQRMRCPACGQRSWVRLSRLDEQGRA